MVRFGLTPSEARVVLAVMACELAEGGYPTREALVGMTGVGDTGLPARLSKGRWLEVADKLPGRLVVYRATERAWATLGFARAPEAAE